MKQKQEKSTTRRYPQFWERAVPLVVVIIGILVVGLAVFAGLVALGIYP